MSRKKAHPAHENHERWLVSYADFITLLFAFFVVMFASSQTDRAKAHQVQEAVKDAFENGHMSAKVVAILGGTVDDKGQGNAQMRGPGGANRVLKEEKARERAVELTPSMQRLTDQLAREIAEGKLSVNLEPRGLVISLKEAAFFSSGQEGVSTASYPTVATIAQLLNAIPNPIRLEGHTDSVPIHNERFRNNWELSAARAIAMMELLRDHFQVDESRMAIVGYGETFPLASNDSEDGRTRNRRVDILVMNEQALIAEPTASGHSSAPSAQAQPTVSSSSAAVASPTGQQGGPPSPAVSKATTSAPTTAPLAKTTSPPPKVIEAPKSPPRPSAFGNIPTPAGGTRAIPAQPAAGNAGAPGGVATGPAQYAKAAAEKK